MGTVFIGVLVFCTISFGYRYKVERRKTDLMIGFIYGVLYERQKQNYPEAWPCPPASSQGGSVKRIEGRKVVQVQYLPRQAGRG